MLDALRQHGLNLTMPASQPAKHSILLRNEAVVGHEAPSRPADSKPAT
jgi:hypothetical protein